MFFKLQNLKEYLKQKLHCIRFVLKLKYRGLENHSSPKDFVLAWYTRKNSFIAYL